MDKIKNEITLYVHEGDFGLPSIDYKCLQILVMILNFRGTNYLIIFFNFQFYLRLHSDHDIKIKTSKFCTAAELPYLYFDKKCITSFSAIFKILQREV